jgi:hypothetical protein
LAKEKSEGRAQRLYIRRAQSKGWREMVRLAVEAGLPVPEAYRRMLRIATLGEAGA